MNASPPAVSEADRARDLIELGLRKLPFCRACGEPTTVVERRGELWLECVTLGRQLHPLRRLITLDFSLAHDRRLLVEAAAA